MKKIIIGVVMSMTMLMGFSLAQYQPDTALEQKVDTAGQVLINLVEQKFDANYDLLLGSIMGFQKKVAGDEKKIWILDRLVEIVHSRINELSHDDEMMKDIFMGVPLEHVAVGQTVRGVSFDGSETAQGVLELIDGKTQVTVMFEGLADPAPDNFYEGWLVRKSPFNFVSTGPLEYKDGKWVNERTADSDISDHNHYVLTIEPNDDDPAPAEHVFEGDL